MGQWRCIILPKTSFFTTLHPYRTLNQIRKTMNVVNIFDLQKLYNVKLKSVVKQLKSLKFYNVTATRRSPKALDKV